MDEEDEAAFEPLPPLVPGPESITLVHYPRQRIPRAWLRTVEGDGSCFFRAVGESTGEAAADLRARVCDFGQQQLIDDQYMPYIYDLMEARDRARADILTRVERFERMREPARYANYLDVMIAATILQRPIAILVRARPEDKLGPFVNFHIYWPDRVPPEDAPNLRPVWLNFHPDSAHYDAIVPDV